MDAVAAGREREIGPVIHEEGDAAALRDGTEQLRRAANRVVVDILQAKLQAADIAGVERLFETLGESGRVERRRGDEIEPRRHPGLTPRRDRS